MTIIAAKVSARGVLVPHEIIVALGNVEEVQIEGRPNAVIITRKTKHPDARRVDLIQRMKAAGLVEDLSWPEPPAVSPRARTRLAEELSHGKPLSELIMEDREEYA